MTTNMHRIAISLFLSILFSPIAIAGQMYRCPGDGVTTYTTQDIPGGNCKAIFYFSRPGWTVVSASDTLIVATYDSSIVHLKNSVKAWVMYSYRDSQEDRGLFFRSYKELDKYTCGANTVTTLAAVEYSDNDGGGKVMASYQYNNATAADIVPDTIGSTLYEKLCSAKTSSK